MSVKSIIIFNFVLIWCGIIHAQEFKSISAKAAQQKYESTLKKAKADYIKELEAALDFAYKTNNKDEVGIIADVLTKLKNSDSNPDDATVPEDKPKTAPGVVLSDKHNALMGNELVNNTYNLVLKREAGKKTFLVMSIFEVTNSYGEVYLNKELVGKWSTSKDSDKPIEIDITKYVVNGLKKYEVELKYKGGGALQVSEVKAEFK